MPTSSQVNAQANGRSKVRVTPQTITSRAPQTGAVIGQVSIATPLQIQDAMTRAGLGQQAWDGIGLERRLPFIDAIRDTLYRQQERIVNTLVDEQGKVPEEARFELLASLELVDYYRRIAHDVLSPQQTPVRLQPHRRFVIERRPYGTVLVIAPWNYPLWLSIGPIVAALAAGNSVVYKPSEYAAQIGEVIAAVLAEAGIPDEVFHILHGYGDVGAALIQAKPDRIVFTGSVPTGKKIAQAAADLLIPVTLELGGKDAAIVLDDADIDRAATGIIWSGMFNAGQTCASVERVIVQRAVADRLVAAMKRVVEDNLAAGDVRTPALAALTTPSQIEIVESQVRDALAQGAEAVTGGGRLSGVGRFFAPTILTGVTPEMRICAEETFGPVVAVMVVDDEQEAVQLNNGAVYGLTASIWTRSERRGRRLARQLEVGNVSINEHLLISGIPEMPWGGVKESGYGRTQGEDGLLEMTYAKTINAEAFRLPFEPFWYPYKPFKRGLLRRTMHALYGPSLRDRLRALF